MTKIDWHNLPFPYGNVRFSSYKWPKICWFGDNGNWIPIDELGMVSREDCCCNAIVWFEMQAAAMSELVDRIGTHDLKQSEAIWEIESEYVACAEQWREALRSLGRY